MEVMGEIQFFLFGLKGELCGVLFDDGILLCMLFYVVMELVFYFIFGVYVYVWGYGLKNKFGKMFEVDEIVEFVD